MVIDSNIENEHEFLVICKNNRNPLKIEGYPTNVEILHKNSFYHLFWLFKRLRRAERIIWHSLFIKPSHIIMLYFFNSITVKSAWAEWETDLTSSYNGRNIAKKIYSKIRKKVQSRFALYIGTSVKSDIIFQNKFGSSSLIVQASYPSGFDLVNTTREYVKYLTLCPDTTKDVINILVGSNSDKIQNQVQILNALVDYRYENIKLIIPLHADNKEPIIEYAQRLFGEKVIFIDDKVNNKIYLNILKTIDIAIFQTISKRVFDNIVTLLFFRKKIYLADKSMLHDLLYDYNITVNKTSAIHEESYDELIKNDYNTIPKDLLERMIDEIRPKENWNEIFYTLKNINNINIKDKETNSKVKFLHVIPPRQNLIYPFIKMTLKEFKKNEHFFQVSHKNISLAPRLAWMDNIVFLEKNSVFKNSKVLFKRLKNADYIIFHSLYLKRIDILKLSLSSRILKKSAWVEWGKDLYNWKSSTKSWLRPLHNILLRRVREQMSVFVAIFPPDELIFRQQFKSKAPIVYASYADVNSIQMLEDTRPNKNNKKTTVNIQIAHSCNEWNNHFELLEKITKYRYKNIKLFIPLSTGYPHNNKIIVYNYAKKLFGDKAICVMNEMEKKEYIKFLWDMDIAVFALHRQAGLGNIIRLLYMGKKVFLPKNSVMYDFFTNNGVEIFDTDSISEMTYDEFIKPPTIKAPHPFIVDMLAEEKLIMRWEKLYAVMQKQNI